MTWSLYPIAQYKEFAPQWDALARSRPGAPFLESLFLQPALDIFGTGQELLCLHQHNGQLDAAAMVQRGPKGMWQTFQPSQLPLGAWIAAEGVDLATTADVLVAKLPGLTLGLGLAQLDPRFFPRPENRPKLRTQDYIDTAWVDVEGSFDAYWDARGKNLKQNTRKQRNKLQAEATPTRLECISTAADVHQAMSDYGALESAGWKTAEGTAIHPDNDQGKFYQQMLQNFCAAGRGRIYRYWFNDKVVAMDLCISDDTAIVILKTTYDESYKQVSPSTLMRQDEFAQLFEEAKFQRIEFYGKVMEWHTRWSASSRHIYHATLYRWALLKTLKTQSTDGDADA
jgi:CelD/BcsL family acetyltransferase involved in cellulose biosynthesis